MMYEPDRYVARFAFINGKKVYFDIQCDVRSPEYDNNENLHYLGKGFVMQWGSHNYTDAEMCENGEKHFFSRKNDKEVIEMNKDKEAKLNPLYSFYKMILPKQGRNSRKRT